MENKNLELEDKLNLRVKHNQFIMNNLSEIGDVLYFLKLKVVFNKTTEKNCIFYAIHESYGCLKTTINLINAKFYGISMFQFSDKYNPKNYDFSKFDIHFEK